MRATSVPLVWAENTEDGQLHEHGFPIDLDKRLVTVGVPIEVAHPTLEGQPRVNPPNLACPNFYEVRGPLLPTVGYQCFCLVGAGCL